MIALARVDNRLIHGQVVEAWLPSVSATRMVVADDLAAGNALTRAAMGLAVPPRVKVEILPVASVDFAALSASPERILLLLRDLGNVRRARECGLVLPALNVGNVHFSPGRVQISPSVFLDAADVAVLRVLSSEGVGVDLRAVPKDKPLHLAEVEARFAAGCAGGA